MARAVIEPWRMSRANSPIRAVGFCAAAAATAAPAGRCALLRLLNGFGDRGLGLVVDGDGNGDVGPGPPEGLFGATRGALGLVPTFFAPVVTPALGRGGPATPELRLADSSAARGDGDGTTEGGDIAWPASWLLGTYFLFLFFTLSFALWGLSGDLAGPVESMEGMEWGLAGEGAESPGLAEPHVPALLLALPSPAFGVGEEYEDGS